MEKPIPHAAAACHQALLLGGAALARASPRTPDIIKFLRPGTAKPEQEAQIRHDFNNIIQFTRLAQRDLVHAQEELQPHGGRGYAVGQSTSNAAMDAAQLKRLYELKAAVDDRLHEYEEIKATDDMRKKKQVVVGSKARQLGLCTDQSLLKMVRGDMNDTDGQSSKRGDCVQIGEKK